MEAVRFPFVLKRFLVKHITALLFVENGSVFLCPGGGCRPCGVPQWPIARNEVMGRACPAPFWEVGGRLPCPLKKYDKK